VKHLFICCILAAFAACQPSAEGEKISTSDKSRWILKGNVRMGNEITLSGSATTATYTSVYKNFVLDLECKTDADATGGIYLHCDGSTKTGYEVFINNNSSPDEWRKTGGLSEVRNVAKRIADNGLWTPVRIEVHGKQIKVSVNNILVTDYVEPDEPWRAAGNEKQRLSQGMFALASYGESAIAFRNIRVKRLPDDAKADAEAIDEQTDEIIKLQQRNFPTIDYHLHLKGSWTKEQAAALSRKYGITYGIAPNCGKNFPVTTDKDIYNWLDTMRNQPFLTPMQAEGREWLDMFSEDAMNKFDYRFTDAMTWTDHKGRRMRLWIPEETFVDDEQQFMDMLVERAVNIITNEPIHIYVNPTFIPDQLASEYHRLWTDERMQKIIDACVKSRVAVEINNRYRIPSEKFIRMAKESEAKFTFGTNNTSPDDVGKLEYSIEMIKACGLTPEDMFIP
jgi:hypothetical protein